MLFRSRLRSSSKRKDHPTEPDDSNRKRSKTPSAQSSQFELKKEAFVSFLRTNPRMIQLSPTEIREMEDAGVVPKGERFVGAYSDSDCAALSATTAATPKASTKKSAGNTSEPSPEKSSGEKPKMLSKTKTIPNHLALGPEWDR